MHRSVRLRTRVPVVGDVIHVMWDVDNIYYKATIEKVAVFHGKRYHDLHYEDNDDEYYVNLPTRKWRFENEDDNRLPRKEREEPHPRMAPSAFPKRGDHVEILWFVDQEFYPGEIIDVHTTRHGVLFHDIRYSTGEEEHFLDLIYRKWKYLGQVDLEKDEEERVEEANTLKHFDDDVASDVKKLIRS